MATITKFYQLDSWKLSRSVSKEIQDIILSCDSFRNDFALRNQIRKSSGSIMDNIAEGFGRGNNKEFITFLGYSNGSCDETQSQLFRAMDSGYITEERRTILNREIERISSMNAGLIQYLLTSPIRGSRYQVKEPEPMYNSIEEFKDEINFTAS